MGKDEMEIKITISKETFDRLNIIVNYFNGINSLVYKDEPEATFEEMIKGAVIKLLEEYEGIITPLEVKDHWLNDKGKLKNNFQKLVKEDGLRQSDIAEITGIDKTTLSSIFNNRNQPSIENFLRIWAVLGFPSIRRCFYRE